MDVLAFDWKTGEFKRELRYLNCVTFGEDEELGISALEVDFFSKKEFNNYVDKLRKELDASK